MFFFIKVLLQWACSLFERDNPVCLSTRMNVPSCQGVRVHCSGRHLSKHSRPVAMRHASVQVNPNRSCSRWCGGVLTRTCPHKGGTSSRHEKRSNRVQDEATPVKITAKKNKRTDTDTRSWCGKCLCSYVSDVSGDLRVYMNTAVTKAHSVVTFFCLRHVTHDRVSSGLTTRWVGNETSWRLLVQTTSVSRSFSDKERKNSFRSG